LARPLPVAINAACNGVNALTDAGEPVAGGDSPAQTGVNATRSADNAAITGDHPV